MEMTDIHAHTYALQDINLENMELTDTALTLKAVVSELIDVADDIVGWNVLEPQLEVVHMCCCATDIAIGRLGAAIERVQDSNCNQRLALL